MQLLNKLSEILHKFVISICLMPCYGRCGVLGTSESASCETLVQNSPIRNIERNWEKLKLTKVTISDSEYSLLIHMLTIKLVFLLLYITLDFNLATRPFNQVIHALASFLTHGFWLASRGFELMACGFELVTRRYKVANCEF